MQSKRVDGNNLARPWLLGFSILQQEQNEKKCNVNFVNEETKIELNFS
jgi:hypothetical protein